MTQQERPILKRIPLYRRVGLRVGILVALVVLLADLLYLPIWSGYIEGLHPAWLSPEAVREAALRLEQTGELEWLSTTDKYTVLADSLLFAILLALLSAWLVSWFATRRVRDLADSALQARMDGSLPGPFECSGRDEITVLAEALNQMRSRAENLLEELRLRDVRRCEWIAQVSHDLRTPVTALSVSLDRLFELSAGRRLDGPETQELLCAARIDIERVRTMTEDLLDIGRLEIGERLRLEPIPAGELVDRTSKALLPLARDRRKELSWNIPVDLPTFQGDGRRLSRALENLVVNSLQHARARVQVDVVHEQGWIRYSVKDDGPGLPTSVESLDEGARAHHEHDLESLSGLAARRRRPDSAGLGLQVASRVAEAHEGTLSARNGPQGGAEFWLQLPVRD